jgi:hypothetical protein
MFIFKRYELMRYFIVTIFLVLSNLCYSQTFINRAGPANTVIDQRHGAAQNFYLPRLLDTTLSGGYDTIGNLIYDRIRGKIAIRDTVLTGGHKFTFIFKQDDTISTLATKYDLAQITITADNGLTASNNNIQLGGTLTQNTTINTTSSYFLNVTGSNVGQSLKGTNTTTGTGVMGQSTSGTGVYGLSSTLNGVLGVSSSGTGLVGESSSGEALNVYIIPSSTNTLATVGRMGRFTSGTAANGIGGAFDWFTQSSGGSAQRSNRIGSSWSIATTLARTSVLEFFGVNNAIEARKAALAGNGQWTWDGYPSLTAQTDTSSYKPIGIDVSGNVVKMSNWGGAASGTGVTDQVTIWTGTNTIGGDAGFTVNPSTNTFYTDSIFLNKKLYFTGNSITPNKATAIQLGDRYNPFYTDTTVGSTTGTIMVVYPKYACDTCRYNQPFYIKVGTTDQGLGLPTNSGIQYGFGSGELNRSLAYDQTEQRFFDQVERYFEFKPEGVNDRIRPFAYNCNITGSIIGNVQALHETDQNIYFSHRYADKVYATTSPNAAKFDPYLTATTNAITSLTHIDSATNATKGGFSYDTQLAGGFYNTSYTYHGQQINVSTPAGFYYNSTGAGQNGSFGRNYIFSVSSANTNKIFWVGKDWGGAYSQAFEVFNNQNTLFGPVNTADFGYKLQAVGSSAAFMAGNITTSTNSVIYPASYVHTLSSGGAAVGFGVGYKFEGHNAVNTKRDIAAMEAVYTDVVNATEDADIVFKAIRAGTANTEGLRVKSTGDLEQNSTGYFKPAIGTTAQRPTGVTGYFRYNSTDNIVEWYNGSAWVQPGTSSTVPLISTGAAAPATTPGKVGDIFIDTVNKKLYFATGTSSSADWTIAN